MAQKEGSKSYAYGQRKASSPLPITQGKRKRRKTARERRVVETEELDDEAYEYG